MQQLNIFQSSPKLSYQYPHGIIPYDVCHLQIDGRTSINASNISLTSVAPSKPYLRVRYKDRNHKLYYTEKSERKLSRNHKVYYTEKI